MSKSATTRFNPPPNWNVKKNFIPPKGWEPDPAWGPAPQGWPLYLTEVRKTHRFRNLFLLTIVAIVVVIAAINASGGSKAPSTPSAGGSSSAPSGAGKTAGLNQKVSVGDLDFVVTSFVCGAKNVGGEFGSKAQGEFCLAKMDVTNHGNSAGTFDDSSQYLYDSAGRKFSADSGADISIPGNDAFLAQINPGNTVHGTVAFDVPTSDFKAEHLALVSGLGIMETPVNVKVS